MGVTPRKRVRRGAAGGGGLVSVGNYVLAQDYSGAWATHYVFNVNGILTDSEEWNYYSPMRLGPGQFACLFLARKQPGGLSYEVIDQSSGLITARVDAAYH